MLRAFPLQGGGTQAMDREPFSIMRVKSRWLRRLLRLSVALLVLCGLLQCATRTTPPVLVDGVRKENRTVTLAGRQVAVSVFYAVAAKEAPVVVVAHGFTRSKRYMAGWGALLAREGFTAVTLTQPELANHPVNARSIADLVAAVKSGALPLPVKSNGRIGLMGHSMGGLTTMLATKHGPVDAWVGLDPVGMNDTWLPVGKQAKMPCLILHAEPGAWNLHGNAHKLYAVLPGPKFSLKVRGASHVDCESPTDFLGQLACGFSADERRAVFERYAVAFFKATLMSDATARRQLDEAGSDPAVSDVENGMTTSKG